MKSYSAALTSGTPPPPISITSYPPTTGTLSYMVHPLLIFTVMIRGWQNDRSQVSMQSVQVSRTQIFSRMTWRVSINSTMSLTAVPSLTVTWDWFPHRGMTSGLYLDEFKRCSNSSALCGFTTWLKHALNSVMIVNTVVYRAIILSACVRSITLHSIVRIWCLFLFLHMSCHDLKINV